MENLEERFKKQISKDLQAKLNLGNPHQVPRLLKIVVNMGVKNAVLDKKNIDASLEELSSVLGQRPKVTKARQSIAAFKLREGDKVGLVATLRGKRMYDFFEKLVNVVFPRLRDFHGIPRKSFDGRGNFTLGFTEMTVFPEIEAGKTDRVQGLEISIVTSAKDNEQGYALLSALGMPFIK